MKPDWKDAPEWANYLAMDEDGYWFWFSIKPRQTEFGYWEQAGRTEFAGTNDHPWKDSLEKRPGDSTSSVDV